ncbi:hypothetical protein ACFXDE_30265 [Kitasatospora sp. NPDC059408]|uniref:hypothetical protein n=1 Tax=Kitasatospora sp. NPDC059408 TaxID=3346823 RepID=UPI0036764194
MTWSREYLPSEERVIGGAPADVAAVEHRAAELLYLDGAGYEGSGEPMRHLDVAGGFMTHYVVPRLELVAICQVTPPIA